MRNKKLLYVLVGLSLVLVVGLGWLVGKRLQKLEGSDGLSTEQGSEYYEKVSEIYVSDGVKKSTNSEKETVYFEFTGVMVEGLTLMEDGSLGGLLIVDGDELKREIPVYFNYIVDVYFGVFESSFEGDSLWNAQSADKVASIVTSNTPVYIKVKHDYASVDEKFKEFLYEHDKVLDSLFKDIINKEWKYSIPNDFKLKPAAIGVVL